MKVNIEALAEHVVKLASMRDSQAPGLAVLFRVVERAAFCDGVERGRSGSYANDPGVVYDHEYSPQATTATHLKTATKARRPRKAAAQEAVGAVREHREQATADPALETSTPEAVGDK